MKTNNGYVNEGKVLLGLSICSKGGLMDCKRCPYDGVSCGKRLTRDALRYILALDLEVSEYEEKEKQKP